MRARLADEGGFTMIVTIGVLTITILLTTAVILSVLGDVHNTRHDLDGKRAYAAALAGINAYTYQLNQNPNYWDNCSNDVQGVTGVPGSTTGEQYSWTYVLANGQGSCSSSDPERSLIDLSTGTLRMEFTGYSGVAGSEATPQVKRTIVASFGKPNPLDFLWYTVYEALDSSISGYSGCGVFLRNGRNSACNVEWFTGDTMNGPMYTQDQYEIGQGATPVLGRGPGDKIESAAPGTAPADICAQDDGNGQITQDDCGSADIQGNALSGQQTIGLPQTNSQLYTDASKYGDTYTGVTTITLNGNSVTVQNCPSSSSSCPAAVTLNPAPPIIYVSTGSGCTPYTYNPFSVSYPTSGCVGDVYVKGNYTSPLTIAAANNIIIDGNITTTGSPNAPTGTATLGLVANNFIRVMHGVTSRGSGYEQCDGATNISSETFNNLTIDAAVMALNHSFIVDNFDCGATTGNLTIYGAIVQYFRGAVETGSGATVSTGYVKKYNYDDRLQELLPPYLFDINIADWVPTRETLCTPGGSGSSAC